MQICYRLPSASAGSFLCLKNKGFFAEKGLFGGPYGYKQFQAWTRLHNQIPKDPLKGYSTFN